MQGGINCGGCRSQSDMQYLLGCSGHTNLNQHMELHIRKLPVLFQIRQRFVLGPVAGGMIAFMHGCKKALMKPCWSSLEQVDEPQCPENGVVLEVLACGVCRSDYHGWTGNHPLVKNGSVLGHEYCGVVAEAGAKAKYKIGDRLF